MLVHIYALKSGVFLACLGYCFWLVLSIVSRRYNNLSSLKVMILLFGPGWSRTPALYRDCSLDVSRHYGGPIEGSLETL